MNIDPPGNLNVQNKQGHCDGEHTVRQRLDAVSAQTAYDDGTRSWFAVLGRGGHAACPTTAGRRRIHVRNGSRGSGFVHQPPDYTG
jgi:hypothetical protein